MVSTGFWHVGRDKLAGYANVAFFSLYTDLLSVAVIFNEIRKAGDPGRVVTVIEIIKTFLKCVNRSLADDH